MPQPPYVLHIPEFCEDMLIRPYLEEVLYSGPTYSFVKIEDMRYTVSK